MLDNDVTRTQVKRSLTNKTRNVVLSLPHYRLMLDIQRLYQRKYKFESVSLSTMTRRALELLKAHLDAEHNIHLERQRTEDAKQGKLNAY